jgi:hypothetical protein
MNCQTRLHRHVDGRLLSRRWFLGECGIGLGAIALSQLWAEGGALTGGAQRQAPTHVPRAKSVIFLFMGGGPIHLELFDHKPRLAELDGTLPPPELLKGYRAAFIDPSSKLLGPRFKFARHGQSGAEMSELLPHMARVADDVAIVKSMVTDAFNHAPAQILLSTGSQQFGKPSVGSWITYGLGSASRDLPAFVVFTSGSKGPSGGSANWSSGFLPTVHQGVHFANAPDPVLYLSSPAGFDARLQRRSLDVLAEMNRKRLEVLRDPEIETRINSYELAYRMQTSVPDLMDASDEPQHILDLYGVEPRRPSFGRNCLLARRLVERGVRFVELFHESWDQHNKLSHDLKQNCADTEQAAAALVIDLKQRGMLHDTLVIWGGEFGRTPMVQGGNDGRDHHPNAFAMWLAGGGVKPGVTLGATDDLGFNVVEDRVHVHDLHATILHLLGLDPERFSFRVQGLDQRLIGVEPASVVTKLLA